MSSIVRLFVCAVAAVAVAFVITSADGGTGPVPVRGIVTLDGTPAAGVKVTFQPENGRPSAAWTDEDGRYVLIYTRQEKGALPGRHQVTIESVATSRKANEGHRRPQDLARATLSVGVRDRRNVIDFDLGSDGQATAKTGRRRAAQVERSVS